MKPCRTCKGDLDFDDFSHNASERDGLSSQCRQCRSVHRTAYVKTATARTYTIVSDFTDGSRCEMTRRSLRLAMQLGEKLYMDSKYAVRVRVRGRKTVYWEWNRKTPQQEERAA